MDSSSGGGHHLVKVSKYMTVTIHPKGLVYVLVIDIAWSKMRWEEHVHVEFKRVR